MSKLAVDDIDRTPEYSRFIHDLQQFHISKGTTLQMEPVLGGKKIDLYKLFQSVSQSGGFDQVTKNRTWKQIGDCFEFPPTCTNSAYILKGLYIRNLMGWEEEKVWGKEWIPPVELLGPDAHKASTLAGKSFKKGRGQQQGQQQQSPHSTVEYHHHHIHYHPLQRPIQPSPHQHDCVSTHDQPFTPDIFVEWASQFVPPVNPDIVVDQPHQCTISEHHHQNQPSYHAHTTKEDSLVHTSFDSSTKDQILTSLQYGSHSQVEWALKATVTISFECPEELRLDRNPSLLESLLKITEISLQQSDEAECMMEHTLQILHILRNLSFIQANAKLLAASSQLKQMMVKNLVLSSSHYTHCIDVLENIARFIDIGPSDNYILCLASLVYANERHVLLGSMRVLTLLSLNKNNHTALIPGSAQSAGRILQLLVVNDEEVIGAALEYLYQYTKISNAFRLQLLTAHSGADIGILVSLLVAKSKYFKPLVVLEQEGLTDAPLDTSNQLCTDGHGALPCVPNLSSYQELDEPYRCLGWLKDKFELADASSTLSLDDMYLLYEIRFGHECALRIKDFYTVLKIAFPKTSTTAPSPPGQPSSGSSLGPVLEGTSVRGIQIKISILQDGSDMLCQWRDCHQTFHDEILLQRHVLHDHINDNSGCRWTTCDKVDPFNNKMEMATHLRTHFGDDAPLYPAQEEEVVPTFASLSLTPSSQQTVDSLPVQGVSLVATHLLLQLSKDPNSHVYFMPYESEMISIGQQRPTLAPYIQTMFSNFRF